MNVFFNDRIKSHNIHIGLGPNGLNPFGDVYLYLSLYVKSKIGIKKINGETTGHEGPTQKQNILV